MNVYECDCKFYVTAIYKCLFFKLQDNTEILQPEQRTRRSRGITINEPGSDIPPPPQSQDIPPPPQTQPSQPTQPSQTQSKGKAKAPEPQPKRKGKAKAPKNLEKGEGSKKRTFDDAMGSK